MAGSKQKRSGCMVALIVVASIGGLAVLATLMGGYFVLTSERGKKVFIAFEDPAKLALESITGPGPDALRRVGCEQPGVTTVDKMFLITGGTAALLGARREFGDQAAQELGLKDVLDETLVLCAAESSSTTAPGCPTLATAYADALNDAPERVIVIARNPDSVITCQGYYDRGGRRLGGASDKEFSFVPEG